MKYVILVGDGMGDYPIATLEGKTPLEAAATPYLDELARRGELGCARTIPPGMEPGSDIANLAIMGYAPARYHTGRAPLEAAALGVKLGSSEVAFRCNLVTLRQEAEGLFMEDYSAGHIGSDEAKALIQALEAALGGDGRHFYPGVSYRHLLVWAAGDAAWRTYPPHDWSGKEVGHLMSDGPQAPLWDLIRASWPVLQKHPMNRERLAAGKKPASSIWLWGQGRPPQLPTITARFGLRGAVISAVDLIRGIGLYAGLTPILVVGATGFLDTNYAGKVAAALASLRTMDLVFLHVEAPDEAGHSGELQLKLQAIADFDAKVVGPLLAGLQRMGEDFRILVLCDHFTPLAVRTHTREPVPYVLYDSRAPGDRLRPYSEAAARDAGLLLEEGADLLPRLLERPD